MFQAVPPVVVVPLLAGIAATVALAQRSPSAVTAEIHLSADMAEAARRLLSALTPAQRARAVSRSRPTSGCAGTTCRSRGLGSRSRS
jgi:hypothetical protein